MRLGAWVIVVGLCPLCAVAQDLPDTPGDSKRDPAAEETLIYAQRHFERGRQHFKDSRFEAALAAFEASLALYASPNVRLYLARTFLALHQPADAANTFEEVMRAAKLREAQEPAYKEARLAASAELEPLRRGLATVVIDAGVDPEEIAAIYLNDREAPVEAHGLPLYAEPGTLRVRVTYRSGRVAEESVVVKKLQQRRIELSLPSEPEGAATLPKLAPIVGAVSEPDAAPTNAVVAAPDSPPDGLLIGAGVGGGIAALGWGTMLVFGALADSKYEELNAMCSGVCSPALQGEVDVGERYQTLANIGLVAGAAGTVALAVFVTLLVANDSEATESSGLAVAPGGVGYRW